LARKDGKEEPCNWAKGNNTYIKAATTKRKYRPLWQGKIGKKSHATGLKGNNTYMKAATTKRKY
jgi:hypothetical protein